MHAHAPIRRWDRFPPAAGDFGRQPKRRAAVRPAATAKAWIYATLWAEGARIEEGATISTFASAEEALDTYKHSFDLEEGEVLALVEGDFGDCWQKTISGPKAHQGWLRPFELEDLLVQAPGSHPGGSFYWTTPHVTVWVPVVVAT